MFKRAVDGLAGKPGQPGLLQVGEEMARRYGEIGTKAEGVSVDLTKAETQSAGMVSRSGPENGNGELGHSFPAEGDPAARLIVAEPEHVTARYEDLEPYPSSGHTMDNVPAFLKHWHDAQAGVAEPKVHHNLTRSDVGSVTVDDHVPSRRYASPEVAERAHTSGRPRPTWPDVVKGDRVVVDGEEGEWTAALDDGVRDMVVAANEELGCPTMSSCEGHPDQDHGWKGRLLRLLPDGLDEANRVTAVLKRSAAAASTDTVSINVLRGDVLSIETGGRHPTLLVEFTPVSGEFDSAYYGALDEVTRNFVRGWSG